MFPMPGNRTYYHVVYKFRQGSDEVWWEEARAKCESLSKSRNHPYQQWNDSTAPEKERNADYVISFIMSQNNKSEREIFDSLFHAINSQNFEGWGDFLLHVLLCVCNGMLGKESVWPWKCFSLLSLLWINIGTLLMYFEWILFFSFWLFSSTRHLMLTTLSNDVIRVFLSFFQPSSAIGTLKNSFLMLEPQTNRP